VTLVTSKHPLVSAFNLPNVVEPPDSRLFASPRTFTEAPLSRLHDRLLWWARAFVFACSRSLRARWTCFCWRHHKVWRVIVCASRNLHVCGMWRLGCGFWVVVDMGATVKLTLRA